MRPVASLRSITVLYLSAFIVSVLASAIITYVIASQSLIRQVDTRLATEASALAVGGNGQGRASLIARLQRNQALQANSDLSYMLVDRAGRRLAGRLRMRLPDPGFSDVEYTDGVEGVDHGRALVKRLEDGSALLLVADYSPIEDFNAKVAEIGGAFLLLTIAIGVLGGIALSRAVSRRIDSTTLIADSIIRGELNRRMPFDGSGGVFDRQAVVLNAMLDRIQLLMTNMQHVTSDIAHDLRTPLARLRNTAARLVELSPPNQVSRELDGIVAQSEKILGLFGAILRIAEVEAGSRRTYFAAVDLGALANELVATFSPSIEAEGGKFILGHIEAQEINGDRELLSQSLINLIDNSRKYAGPAALIELVIKRLGTSVRIVVKDCGPGIPPQDREKALRRFGRLDDSRTLPGNGLGLPLVASVARLHGGELTLDDANPGLVAKIELPLQST